MRLDCHQRYAGHAGGFGIESQHGLAAHALVLRKKQTFIKVASGVGFKIAVKVQCLLRRIFPIGIFGPW